MAGSLFFFGGGGGGDKGRGTSIEKRPGVLVRNFESNPLEGGESRFMGMDEIHFYPYTSTNSQTSNFCHIFVLLNTSNKCQDRFKRMTNY